MKLVTKYVKLDEKALKEIEALAAKEHPIKPGKGNASMMLRVLIEEALEARRRER